MENKNFENGDSPKDLTQSEIVMNLLLEQLDVSDKLEKLINKSKSFSFKKPSSVYSLHLFFIYNINYTSPCFSFLLPPLSSPSFLFPFLPQLFSIFC